MRKTLIVAALIVVIAGGGAWIYFSLAPKNGAPIAVTPTGGTNLPVGQNVSGGTLAEPIPEAPAPLATIGRLVKISAGPVVPGTLVLDVAANPSASTTAGYSVEYINRQSGNVYAYSSVSRTITRTNNKTLPGIQRALWLPGGTAAYVQYLSGEDFSTVNTYLLPASGSGGSFLEKDLADIAVASTSILTLASGVNGSIASVRRTDGARSEEAFSTPLTSLRVAFAGKSRYVAYTKPSSVLPGTAFLVDSSKRFTRLAGPLPGLSALPSPSGETVLVTYVNGSTLRAKLVTVATGVETNLPVGTLVEKCVWTADSSAVYCGVPLDPPAAAYPDDWYQGAVSLSDRIWKIDVNGRYAELVLDFAKETGTLLDTANLSINTRGTILVLSNKTDGSLWAFSL